MATRKQTATAASGPSPARLDHSQLLGMLGYHLHCADARSTQYFRANVTAACGINPADFAVLCMLDTNSDVSPKMLSVELGIAPPNVAVLIASLEKRGIVCRIPNHRDARSTHLELSSSGRETLRKARKLVAAGDAELMSAMTESQKKTLFKLLSLIHQIGLEQ